MRRLLSMLLAVIATLAPSVASVASPMQAPGRAIVEARTGALAGSSIEGGDALGLGVFLQRDPNGYQDSVNQYAYGANDPINHRDPTGEFGEPGDRAFGAAVGLGMSDWTAEKLYEAEIYRCQMLWGASRETCESIPSDVAQGVALGSALKGLTPADLQNAAADRLDAARVLLAGAGLVSAAALVPIVPRTRSPTYYAWRDMLASVLDAPSSPSSPTLEQSAPPFPDQSRETKTLREWLKDDPELLAEARSEHAARPQWQGIDPDNAPVFLRTKAEIDEIRRKAGEGGGHHPHGLVLGGPEGQKLTPTGETLRVKNPAHSAATSLQVRLKNRIRGLLKR